MSSTRDGSRDFDFLHGKWMSVQRRLAKRLQNSDEWVEYEAEVECHSILGGTGNSDSYHGTLPDGGEMNAMSIRLYDADSGLWNIYWLAKGSPEIFPPVHGSFENGIGLFYGNDIEGGVPVKVIFRWSDITPTSATWEQRFSADDGSTWETNWFMHFTRVE